GAFTATTATGTSGFTCVIGPAAGPPAVAAGTVSCTGGALAAGATATITITGTVTDLGGANPSTISDTATVDPANTIVESNECNLGSMNPGNTATITVTGSVTASPGTVLTDSVAVDPNNVVLESNEPGVVCLTVQGSCAAVSPDSDNKKTVNATVSAALTGPF